MAKAGKERKPPECKSCGRVHFNFLHCEEVDDYMTDLDARRKRRQVTVIRHLPPPEGLTPWADRPGAMQHIGGNRFVRTRDKDA